MFHLSLRLAAGQPRAVGRRPLQLGREVGEVAALPVLLPVLQAGPGLLLLLLPGVLDVEEPVVPEAGLQHGQGVAGDPGVGGCCQGPHQKQQQQQVVAVGGQAGAQPWHWLDWLLLAWCWHWHLEGPWGLAGGRAL